MSKKMGRPSLGVTRKVSLTLPAQVWSDLAGIAFVDKKTQAALLRDIIIQQLYLGSGLLPPS